MSEGKHPQSYTHILKSTELQYNNPSTSYWLSGARRSPAPSFMSTSVLIHDLVQHFILDTS